MSTKHTAGRYVIQVTEGARVTSYNVFGRTAAAAVKKGADKAAKDGFTVESTATIRYAPVRGKKEPTDE
jgi:hypothetical protein